MARNDDDQHAGRSDESIGAATRALADATAALTKILGRQVQSVMPEVSEAIATSLREASRGLADASESVERKAGARRSDERRRERVDRTRTDLLDAAARVFAAHGYEGASVGDIAAEAGYTKGALYAHFGSKSEVFLEIARQRLGAGSESDAACIPGMTAGTDPADVQPALAAWLRDTQDDPHLLLALEFLSYGLRHPESRAELGAVHEASFRVLAEQIAELRALRAGEPGRGDGRAEPTQDDWDTALAIVGVSNIATLYGTLTGSPHASPEAGARIIARLLGT